MAPKSGAKVPAKAVKSEPGDGAGKKKRRHRRKESYSMYIIGSAEALPILCVSDFCERERERERETPVTSFDITLKSRVIMHMITSTARRPNASTRSESVECSCIRQGAWCLSARAAGNGRVIYE